MPSSVSVLKRVPVATNGIALIHVDFLLTGIVMTFIGPMLPILSARWSLTDARSGSLIFFQFFSSMLGMLLSGVFVQRWGYRFTLIAGAVLMASGMALLASGPWLLGIAAVCILGIGYGLTTPAGNLRTAEINPARSASALNVINAVWGVGAMSSPFLVAIAQREHHPGYFLYGTAAALVVLLLALLLTRFVPDTHAHVESPLGSKNFWKDRLLPLICLLFFVYVGTETSFGAWIATYARRVDSKAHAFATLTPSFYWGALLLGRALAPIILRFHSPIAIARAGLGVAMLGGLALVAAHGIKLVVVGAVLAGLGLASIFPISVSLLPGWFGASARRASGAVFASGNVGGAVVPWFMGEVSTHAAGLRAAFVVPLLGVLAMLVFYLTNRAPPRLNTAETADLLLD
jgi:FHS family glucose/mannose:H+ symporter-like MFS transporter